MKKMHMFIGALIVLSIFPISAKAKEIPIKMDYKAMSFDQMPIVQDQRVYIPLRGVTEVSGGQVDWNSQTKTVTVKKDGDTVTFKLNDTYGYVNGTKKEMPEAISKSGRTMVPVRFVSENVGLKVDWNTTEGAVYIFTSDMVKIDGIIQNAEKYIGTPYLYGGTYEKNKKFDCSAFVQKVFAERGIYLPRTTYDQVKQGKAVTYSQLKKGDLVFFDISGNGTISHVAIYIDKDTLLQATVSKGVSYTSFNSYWTTRMKEFRRIL